MRYDDTVEGMLGDALRRLLLAHCEGTALREALVGVSDDPEVALEEDPGDLCLLSLVGRVLHAAERVERQTAKTLRAVRPMPAGNTASASKSDR